MSGITVPVIGGFAELMATVGDAKATKPRVKLLTEDVLAKACEEVAVLGLRGFSYECNNSTHRFQ